MAFHINPETGEPGPCRATLQCRFGSEQEHYDSPDDARSAYELSMNNQLIESLQKRNESLTHSLRTRKFSESELERVGYGEYDNGDGVYFTKEDRYDRESWSGKLTEGPEDVEIRFSFSDHGNPSPMAALYVREERYELSEPELSALEEDEYDVSRRSALAMSSAVDEAREKYPQIFDEERNSRIKAKAEDYDLGRVKFGGYDLERTGHVAPEIWESKVSDTPGVHETYVRVRHGVASMRAVTDNDIVSIHSATIHGEAGSFNDSSEAGRFFVEAEENFEKFISEMQKSSEYQTQIQ